MNYQVIKIKLTSFDHEILRRAASKIITAISHTDAKVNGPIPLPNKKKIYTVLKSPHANKKARDQFISTTHRLLLQINNSTSTTVDALMKLELSKGVEPKISV